MSLKTLAPALAPPPPRVTRPLFTPSPRRLDVVRAPPPNADTAPAALRGLLSAATELAQGSAALLRAVTSMDADGARVAALHVVHSALDLDLPLIEVSMLSASARAVAPRGRLSADGTARLWRQAQPLLALATSRLDGALTSSGVTPAGAAMGRVLTVAGVSFDLGRLDALLSATKLAFGAFGPESGAAALEAADAALPPGRTLAPVEWSAPLLDQLAVDAGGAAPRAAKLAADGHLTVLACAAGLPGLDHAYASVSEGLVDAAALAAGAPRAQRRQLLLGAASGPLFSSFPSRYAFAADVAFELGAEVFETTFTSLDRLG